MNQGWPSCMRTGFPGRTLCGKKLFYDSTKITIKMVTFYPNSISCILNLFRQPFWLVISLDIRCRFYGVRLRHVPGALEVDPEKNSTKLIFSGYLQNINKNKISKVPKFPQSAKFVTAIIQNGRVFGLKWSSQMRVCLGKLW